MPAMPVMKEVSGKYLLTPIIYHIIGYLLHYIYIRSRQSRSVERHSRIPLRSSSSQAINRCGPSGYQPAKDRSRSVASVVGETPVHLGKSTPSQSNLGSRATSSCSSNRGMKKMNFAKDTRNLHDKEYLKEASHVVSLIRQHEAS